MFYALIIGLFAAAFIAIQWLRNRSMTPIKPLSPQDKNKPRLNIGQFNKGNAINHFIDHHDGVEEVKLSAEGDLVIVKFSDQNKAQQFIKEYSLKSSSLNNNTISLNKEEVANIAKVRNISTFGGNNPRPFENALFYELNQNNFYALQRTTSEKKYTTNELWEKFCTHYKLINIIPRDSKPVGTYILNFKSPQDYTNFVQDLVNNGSNQLWYVPSIGTDKLELTATQFKSILETLKTPQNTINDFMKPNFSKSQFPGNSIIPGK